MLVSPLANPAGWLWTHADVVDIPGALRGHFPPAQPSAADSMLPPVALPPGIAGTGPATTLRFPWTGRAQHRAGGGAQWLWGATGDLLRFPELRSALPFGNPLIVMRFTHALEPPSGAFPAERAIRQSPVVLAGPVDASITDFTMLAAYPLRPGMDTLAVLRHLRAVFNTAFPDGHPERLLATSWAAFVASLDALPQRLRLLEPSGAPVETAAVVLNRTSTEPLLINLAASDNGDMVAASGLSRADFDAAVSLDVSAGSAVAAATPQTAFPTGIVPFTAADSHIDLAVLDQWLAPNGAAALPRFTRRNRVTAFVNGPEYFADLFTELNAMVTADPPLSPPGLFYLTGYSLMHDIPLIPTSLGLPHRTVAAVAAAMAAQGAEARFLALQFVQLQPGVLDTVEISAQVAGVILSMASMAMAGIAEDGWDRANFLLHTQLIAWALILGSPTVGELMPILEANKGAIDALAAIPSVEAALDPYSAAQSDNPLSPAPGAHALMDAVRAIQERFGGFHQKIAIVGNGSGLHAWCGGIDLNANRLDDRDHGIRHPYHDVHARIDGPAAADLAQTFVERWQTAGRSTLSIGTPTAEPASPEALTNVVQVGRTYFAPAAGAPGLPFAPNGERTIIDTQMAAISRARRYIYIEDQYLTPPAEYTAALAAAASRVSGPLIIVIPELPDQPFGLAPRQAFILAMQAAWGERFKVGTLRMRFSRSPTSVASAAGRLWLTKDVAEADATITVGPVDRLPALPFWLVVGNEVMRATRKVSPTTTPTPDSVATEVELAVQRAGETRLFGATRGTDRKSHKAKAPVTGGAFAGIYVHAKTMLIDDVFAAIGSANVNRRGYYSDGECNIFAIPEMLTHGDNWIRDLRTRLWAEALGTTEDYARAAFANPAAHLDLWDRKFTVGSRFSPFEAQPLLNELELRTALTSNSSVLDVLGFSVNILGGVADVVAGAEAGTIFNTVVDPSSWVDRP